MIRYAKDCDLPILKELDHPIAEEELIRSIRLNRILVCFENEQFVGWLRFNLFWDHLPFMNMLVILEKYRHQGKGKELVAYWENEMKNQGYDLGLTSTQANEQGQFFYRKNGYVDCGFLTLYEEPKELFLMKRIEGEDA